MKVLVTGAAGFIGHNLSRRLLSAGHEVLGVDNVNDYYDPSLKRARLATIESDSSFTFLETGIETKEFLEASADFGPTCMVNLAAQAGVRYSLENPRAYIDANVVGFANVLEACRGRVAHLVYASSSSVYGGNEKQPFSVDDRVDHPLSLYAATKRANELMAHTYSHLFQLPTTGLRFFTVYGPWGRPDMALFLFTRAILAGEPIRVFNHGKMSRDFTYVDDIVEGVVRLVEGEPPTRESSHSPSGAPYRLFNIGNSNPEGLMDMIGTLERHLGTEAKKEFLPMQPGDVPATSADVAKLEAAIDFKPSTSIDEGIGQFVAWYRAYYGV